MLNKTRKQLKNQWEKAAEADNYRNAIAKGYNDEKSFRHVGKTQTKALVKLFDKHGIKTKQQRIVEIGCGTGRITEFLSKEVEFMYATDISMKMLNRFNDRLSLSNVALVCSDNISFIPDESVDMILSMLVFQHNPEHLVYEFFDEGSRILKPGGHYVFQLTAQDKHQVVQDNRATDMVRWTVDEVKSIAEKYNFKMLNDPKEFFKIWQKI